MQQQGKSKNLKSIYFLSQFISSQASADDMTLKVRSHQTTPSRSPEHWHTTPWSFWWAVWQGEWVCNPFCTSTYVCDVVAWCERALTSWTFYVNVYYDNNLRYLYSINAEALSDFHKQQVANFLLATRSSQCRITRKWFHFPKVSLSFFFFFNRSKESWKRFAWF